MSGNKATERACRTTALPIRLGVTVVWGCLAACLWITPAGMAAAQHLQPDEIRVDLPPALLRGALPINRGLTLSVELPAERVGKEDLCVAIFTSPAFVEQISPLVQDPERSVLATSVPLGPIAAS